MLTFTLLLAFGLEVGQKMPELRGEYLTGREAKLPAAGRVALYALGFSYDARGPVEAWVGRFEKDFASKGVDCYEVPVIGGLGMMAKPFINRGMRNGTPVAKHEKVLTVYGGAGALRKAYGVKQDAHAVIVLTDAQGVVRWRYEGVFDEGQYGSLKSAAEALLR